MREDAVWEVLRKGHGAALADPVYHVIAAKGDLNLQQQATTSKQQAGRPKFNIWSTTVQTDPKWKLLGPAILSVA